MFTLDFKIRTMKLYHKSNPIFRDKIMIEGLIPKGKSEAWLSDTKIEGEVIFATMSENREHWFCSTYDDDIYEIECCDNIKWHLDPNFGKENFKYCYTYQKLSLDTIKLIYKGSGKDLLKIKDMKLYSTDYVFFNDTDNSLVKFTEGEILITADKEEVLIEGYKPIKCTELSKKMQLELLENIKQFE